MSVFESNHAVPLGAISTYRLVSLAGRVVEALAAWRNARVTRRSLLALSDRQLSDIGRRAAARSPRSPRPSPGAELSGARAPACVQPSIRTASAGPVAPAAVDRDDARAPVAPRIPDRIATPPGAWCRGELARQPPERAGEDVREDQVVGAARVQARVAEARGRHAGDPAREAVRRDVGPRRRGRQRVDVPGDRHAPARPAPPPSPAPRCRRRCRRPAAPPGRAAPAGRAREAALRRRMVPGAEGLRRLDLERHPVRRHPRPVVAAVDDEAPGRRPA